VVLLRKLQVQEMAEEKGKELILKEKDPVRKLEERKADVN
jgi:hypothetical protein